MDELSQELEAIISKIQEIRARNNVLHCDLIRLLYMAAPDEARKLFREIEKNDRDIVELGKQSAAL